MRKRIILGTTAALLGLALTGCASTGPQPAPASPTPDASPADGGLDVAAAKAHCAQSGGTVQERQPTFGTNNEQSSWASIGAPVEVCRYQTLEDDRSVIFADLATVYADAPTLAALAYLSKPALPSDVTGNPSAAMCVDIGGAYDYGNSPDGGGLVDLDDADIDVANPCVFADGSFIDAWGIAYYGGDTIRGKDLTEVFRFDQTALPDVQFQ